MMSRARRLGSLAPVAALLLGTGVSPVAASASPVTMNVAIGGMCVSGLNTTGQHLALVLTKADGTFIDSVPDATANPSYGGCFTKRVHIGDKLRATWGTSNTRQVTVPDLTIVAERVTDVVTGHAPAGKVVQILYSDCHLSGCGGYQTSDRLVDDHGRFRKDLTSHIDLLGADRVAVNYANSHGDTFGAFALVPYLQLSKPNDVHIECQPDRALNVTLKTATGSLRATRVFGAAGACASKDGTFRKNGAAVDIAAGNVIRSDLASDVKIIWPHVGVSGVGTRISGRCLPNAPIGVQVIRTPTPEFGYYRTAGPDGRFSDADIGFTFLSGYQLLLTCSTPTGDRITATSAVP